MFGKLFDDIFSANSANISVNGHTIRMSNGDLFVDGQKVELKDLPKEGKFNSPGRVEVKDGGSYTIKGDMVGNLTLVGDHITVNIVGDAIGNISGAKHVNVSGDHVGMSI